MNTAFVFICFSLLCYLPKSFQSVTSSHLNSKNITKISKILTGPPLPANFWNRLNQTVGNYILEYIRENEDRVYMINGETNEQMTLSQLSEQSSNFAAYLQSLGYRSSQTTVAIYSENHINYMIAQLGIWLSGSTPATLNYLYTYDELKHAINVVKPTVLICSLQTYSIAKETLEKNEDLKHLILLDNPPSPLPNTSLFSNVVKKSDIFKLIKPSNDPSGPAQILFSSGTEGLPKGVLLTHSNILYILQMIKIFDLFQLEGKYTLTTLPMYHGFGMFVSLFTMKFDMTQIFLKKFDENLYLSLIEKYKIRSLYLVPPMVVTLLKSELIKNYDISSVKHIICGSATVKIDTEMEIKEKLKLNRFQQGYGLTESSLSLTIKKPENQKPGSCGTLVPGVNGKVIDTETGELLGPGETGELCFMTPGLMRGYIDDLKATADTIRDGWLHTGDLGYYDKDGDFFVIDRLKELIKYKAHQVAPAELEALLLQHDDVKDAGVVGIPDDLAGELPTAFIVRKNQSRISEKELQEYVASKVSPHKWLRGGVTFIDKIPKNPSGKILRRKLRKLAVKKNACKLQSDLENK